ncbi:type II toxin-antitoxin system HicB family antitoxin [Vreelandella sp. H-I2]
MNSQVLEYKGYQGAVETSIADGVLHGKILHINDLVTYEGETIAELKAAFEESVDEYLEMCEEEGIEPDKPYKGSLNVRIGSDVHRKLALAAARENITINETIKKILEMWLRDCPDGFQVVHHHTHNHIHEAPDDDIYHGQVALTYSNKPKPKLRVVS